MVEVIYYDQTVAPCSPSHHVPTSGFLKETREKGENVETPDKGEILKYKIYSFIMSLYCIQYSTFYTVYKYIFS